MLENPFQKCLGFFIYICFMGMRGKKRKHLNQEQRQLVKQFDKWCRAEIEKDFIKQLQNYDPVPAMLNGIGITTNLSGVYTLKADLT